MGRSARRSSLAEVTHAVIFTPAAKLDVIEARDWYGARSPAAMRGFIAELDRQVGRIRENPVQFPVVSGDVRRTLLRRFPYALLYRDTGEGVVVIVCFHARRDPKVWRRRV